MTYDLYDGTPPHQKHSSTSRAAAEMIRESVGDLQYRVYLELVDSGSSGLIDEEIIEAFSFEGQDRANAIRPRRIELMEKGLVCDSGRVRKTSKGRDATIWLAVHPDDAPKFAAEFQKKKQECCPTCGLPPSPPSTVIRMAIHDIRKMSKGYVFSHLEESKMLGNWLRRVIEEKSKGKRRGGK